MHKNSLTTGHFATYGFGHLQKEMPCPPLFNRAIGIAACLTLSLTLALSPAHAATDSSLNAEITVGLQNSSLMRAIVDSRANPAHVQVKRAALEKATAFTTFVRTHSEDPELVLTYLASRASMADIEKLAQRTKGHHFAVSREGDALRLTLVPRPAPSRDMARAQSDVYGYACWRAAAAALAWAVGTGMLCAPLGSYSIVCGIGSTVLFPIN